MQYAPLGSLEEYLAERSGLSDETPVDVKRSGQKVEDVKAAFRRRRSTLKEAGGAERKGEQRGVRLMSKSEVDVIFGGIVKGLGYLVRSNHFLLPAISRLRKRESASKLTQTTLAWFAPPAQPRPAPPRSQVLERAAVHGRVVG